MWSKQSEGADRARPRRRAGLASTAAVGGGDDGRAARSRRPASRGRRSPPSSTTRTSARCSSSTRSRHAAWRSTHRARRASTRAAPGRSASPPATPVASAADGKVCASPRDRWQQSPSAHCSPVASVAHASRGPRPSRPALPGGGLALVGRAGRRAQPVAATVLGGAPARRSLGRRRARAPGASPRCRRRSRPPSASPCPRGRGRRWGVAAGDVVTVGGRPVLLPGYDIVAVRTWRPPASAASARSASGAQVVAGASARRPRAAGTTARPWPAPSGGSRTAPRRPRLGCARWSPGCLAGADADSAVARLSGAAPGLTPSGDDVLGGSLLVAHAVGTPAPPRRRPCAPALGAHHLVSAALLDAAARRVSHPEVSRSSTPPRRRRRRRARAPARRARRRPHLRRRARRRIAGARSHSRSPSRPPTHRPERRMTHPRRAARPARTPTR